MKINRDNYEAFLLDLVEGRLSAKDQQEVRDFLLLNPDCAEEIHAMEPWILEKGTLQLPGKEQLKKEIPDSSFMLTENNFDLFSIARLEGDLNEKQESDYANMVASSEEKNREWKVWQNTKLKGETIIYAQKNQLKRRKGISRRVIWMSVISSAAVIALFFTVLRIDPVSPDKELVLEDISSDPALEEAAILDAMDPLTDPPETSVVIQEKPKLLADEPVLFSIKKQPDRPIDSDDKGPKDSVLDEDTVKQVRQEQIQSKPIRIASYISSYSDHLDKGSYDLIHPLEIPPTSIHLSSLSISQLAELDLQEVFDGYTKEKNISLWTIANAGIPGN